MALVKPKLGDDVLNVDIEQSEKINEYNQIIEDLEFDNRNLTNKVNALEVIHLVLQ